MVSNVSNDIKASLLDKNALPELKRNYQKIINTLMLAQNSNNQNSDSYIWNTTLGKYNYKLDYKFNLKLENEEDEKIFIFALKTKDNKKVSPYTLDIAGVYVDYLKRVDASNSEIISKYYIENFNNIYKIYQDYYQNIDWEDPKAVYKLNKYKERFEGLLARSEKLKKINDIFEFIFTEKAKPDANQELIDQKTNELIALKKAAYAEQFENSFGGFILEINEDRANEELHYAKEDTLKLIKQANRDLKLYNKEDELVIEIEGAAKILEDSLNDAKKAKNDNQQNIDNINKQMEALNLSPEDEKLQEKKEELQRELEKAKEKDQELDDQIQAKNEELEELKNKLANSSLKNLGLHSQAYGYQAFASGDNSIAMGTSATVTANSGVAIGQNTSVTGLQSIAIGMGSTVSGEKSIAIGLGHNVSGNRSTTIGDPNVVSGNDSFVAGNNNNVASNNAMVIGNNITIATGFDKTIVLGDDSVAAKANPFASMAIKGITYGFAGNNPTSTLSIGKSGEERQITNVAAGRISSTSTDAINGSQLYAAIDSINKLSINDGGSVVINGGNGIKVDKEGDNYNISLKDPVNVVGDDNIAVNKDPNSNTFNLSFTDPTEIVGDENILVNKEGNRFNISLKNPPQPTQPSRINNERVDNLGKQVRNINNRLDDIENKVNGFDGRIVSVEQKVAKMDKKMKAGIASALATAGLPQPHREGQSGIVASIGQYQNQTGLAIGYSKISDNGKWLIKGSVSTNTGKEFGGQVGVGYFW